MNAISSVYNYYVTTQPKKQLTGRYDAHEKEELKDIYNSIVKMSKESPVYIYDHSKETYKFAINIKEEARGLKNTLSALTADRDSGSVFGQKIAVSSNPAAVSVNYMQKQNGRTDDGFDIEVEQLATPQVNTGTYLSQNRLKLIPNSYSFDIQTGGLSYEFQFKVSHDDTNRTIQDRLVSLINRSDIGITAEVIENEDGFSAISLTSDSTGSSDGQLIFHISDEHASLESGAVKYFGLDKVFAEPRNAFFILDGDRHTATSNNFTVNQNFEITLHDITGENQPAVIAFQTDIDTVSHNIKEMTQKYNSMIRISGSYAGDLIRSNLLQKNISSAARRHESTLESIGLQLTENGSIAVDEQLLGQALTEDMTDTIDSLVGFKASLLAKTEEVLLNPMDYVDKKIVAYPNPGKSFANPYLTSIYSGMLFNSYC